jgi:hypothetical protein
MNVAIRTANGPGRATWDLGNLHQGSTAHGSFVAAQSGLGYRDSPPIPERSFSLLSYRRKMEIIHESFTANSERVWDSVVEPRQSGTWMSTTVVRRLRCCSNSITRLYPQHPRRYQLELLESLTSVETRYCFCFRCHSLKRCATSEDRRAGSSVNTCDRTIESQTRRQTYQGC